MKVTTSGGTVEVFQSLFNGQWYWHVQAENNEIIAVSEGYETREGALKGIAALAEVFEGWK